MFADLAQLATEPLDFGAELEDDLVELADRSFEVRVPHFEIGESIVHGSSFFRARALDQESPVMRALMSHSRCCKSRSYESGDERVTLPFSSK